MIFELSLIDNHLIKLIYKNIDKALSLSSFNTIIYFLKYFETENGNNYSHQKIEEL